MPIFRDLDPQNLPDVSDARLIPVISELLVLFGVNLYTLQKDQSEKIQADFLASIRHLDLEDLAELNIPSLLEKILEPLGLKISVDYVRDEGVSREVLQRVKKIQQALEEIIKENQAALGEIGAEAIEANLQFSLAEIRKEGEVKENLFETLLKGISQKLGLAQGLNNLAAQLKNLFVDLKDQMAQAGSTLFVKLTSGTAIRLKSAVLVDTSHPEKHQVVIGFKAPRKDPKEKGQKFEHLKDEDKKEAACLATTHLLNQLEHSGLYSPAPKPRSVHIHLKTLAHLAAVAAHDARMHHLHQLFASHVSSDFPDSSYVSVQDAKLQTVLALMGAINAEFALPVSQLAGLYGSKVSNHSIPMGPTPGVR